MPIYEYACEACGHRFEKLMRISSDPPSCPNCDGDEVKKLVSASGFILKGSGWYKDHYGLKGSSASKGGEGTSTKSGAADSAPSKSTTSTSDSGAGSGGSTGGKGGGSSAGTGS